MKPPRRQDRQDRQDRQEKAQFEVRRVGGYDAPHYPNSVPDEAKPPMIGAKASALAPLAFIAIAPLTIGATGSPAPTTAQEPSSRSPREAKPIERLPTEEVEKLVSGLVEVQERGGAMELGGKPMPIESRMGEAEVRALLDAFLKKNGFAAEAVRVVTELSEEERDVLALRRARGEARVMMVETAQLEYSRVAGAGRLPTKKAVIFELMGKLEGFLRE